MNLKDTLTAFLVSAKNAGCQRLCVAYSGGIDSHVLLEQLAALNKGCNLIPLDAIYVNHNLQAESKSWGQHCQTICSSLDIPLKILDVQAKANSGESPEQKARDVRYKALASELEEEHWLVTAQHLDDQAETVLLQLLRGSGVDGLASMPSIRPLGRGSQHRPLLEINKQQIEKYASENNLHWIEDPTNQDQTIPRNYLRKSIIPNLKKVWPETPVMLERSAKWLGEAAEMLKDVAKQDLLICQTEVQSIKIKDLQCLEFNRQKNLLRYWFHSMGLKRPGNEKLAIIFDQIINSKDDAKPELKWQDYYLRRYQQQLFLSVHKVAEVDWEIKWDGFSSVNLMGGGSLTVTERMGSGLSKSYQDKALSLRNRQGGERCQPSERNRSRSLKKLFHEYSIPPWQRNIWPLLYCDEELIAVPGLFICNGYQSDKTEVGLELLVNLKN